MNVSIYKCWINKKVQCTFTASSIWHACLRSICKLRFGLFDRAIILIFAFSAIIRVWLIVNNLRHRCGDSRWLRIPRKGIRGHKCALLQLTQLCRNWTITSVRENVRLGSCRLCESVIDVLRPKWSTIECYVRSYFYWKIARCSIIAAVHPYINIRISFILSSFFILSRKMDTINR